MKKNNPFEMLIDAPRHADSCAQTLNPLDKLPALEIGEGHMLSDTRVIVEYLETLEHEIELLAKPPGARVDDKQIEALADGVCQAVVLMVLECARKASFQSEWWISRQPGNVTSGICAAANLLGTRHWYVEDMFGAGMSVGRMLAYAELRVPEVRWRGSHPNLDALSQRLWARR